MKFSNLGYKYKLFGLVLLIIILLTASILLTISGYVNRLLRQFLFKNEINNLKKDSSYFSEWLQERKTDLKLYASYPELIQGSWEQKEEFVRQEMSPLTDDYFSFFIANTRGNYSSTRQKDSGNIRDRDYFQEIISGKTIVSEPIISRSTERPIIVVGTPLKNPAQEITGMLGAEIELQNLSDLINQYSNNTGDKYSFILDNKGRIISHPHRDNILEQELDDPPATSTEWKQKVMNDNSGNYKCEANFIFYHSIPETGDWKMVKVVSRNYLQETRQHLNFIIIVIGLFGLLISSILTIYISHNISEPLVRLNNIFKKGARGNLNVRADINTDDEIGQAADSFNQMMEVINDLTYNDPLTGLPNFNFFTRQLKTAINHLEDANQHIYVGALGINDFKSINDRFGQPGGDQILKAIADKLADWLNHKHITRLSDEFYFFIIEESPQNNLSNRCLNLLEYINQSYSLNDNLLYITARLGLSVFPHDSQEAETLIKNAGLAMHAVGENSNIRYYSENIEEDLSARKQLETELSTALTREQFRLHYQPLVNTRNGRVIGMEALIRWDHPEKGIISPGIFIPIAEKTGFIEKMGRWVLDKAIRDLKHLEQQGFKDIFVSINVSPDQFHRPDFVENIQATLTKHKLKPGKLELEITERTAMGYVKNTINSLKKLKELGTLIALDDFGTGYSSLNYLQKFSLNTLKIDKSFIDNFPNDPDKTAIVETIISIGHNLGLNVVAEGVETGEQLRVLKQLDCDIIQGFYFSRPVELDKFIDLLPIIADDSTRE